MTTDNPIKSWIKERREIHTKAELKARVASDRGTIYTAWTGAHDSGGLPEDDREHIADSYPEGAEAITDALNMFPRALNALERVLELHVPETEYGPDYYSGKYPCVECNRSDQEGLHPTPWPCPTVQAIEGAINHE